MISKNYHINHVPMVESKIDKFKKKIHLPAAIFNKSPFKDSQNKSSLMNRSNTPTYRNNPSPLKSYQQENSLLESGRGRSSNRSSHSNLIKKTGVKGCRNHENKLARYIVQSDDQQISYCEKCAILLASQGFKVVRMDMNTNESLSELDNHPRKIEIESFLKEQQTIVQQMINKKNQIQNILTCAEESFQQQLQMINSYYSCIFNLIENHKQNFVQQLAREKLDLETPAKKGLEIIKECIADSNLMKQDILSSVQVIRQIQQRSFRPVMESYKLRSNEFKQNSSNIKISNINLRSIYLNNPDKIAQTIIQKILKINQQSEEQQAKQSENFSFDNQGQNQQVITSQQEEDEQNLIQDQLEDNQSYHNDYECQ